MAAVERAIASLGERRPNEIDACTIFAALGIPSAPSAVIRAPGDPVNLGFPVVAKVLSADVPHKTNVGGVVIGLNDEREVREAAAGIIERVSQRCPEATLDGILVQRMERGLVEVILGFRRDPEVGPIVVLGVGGVLAEVYRDVAIRIAPTTPDEARSMIDEVRGLAVIRGYRNLPKGDCAALAEAIVAFSGLAAIESAAIAEAEINPLLVKAAGEGVVAVDGLIVLQRK